MWTIGKSLIKSAVYLFVTWHDRWIVIGLIMLAATVSVAELATAQLFSMLILPAEPRTTEEILVLGIGFLLVFGALRLIHYVQSVYQVNVFEKAFAKSESSSKLSESWRWATAMELISILTQSARLFVISIALLIIAPKFGLANLVVAVVIFEILGASVRRQFQTQAEFREQQLQKTPPSQAERVRARIKAGALGSFLASIGIMLMLGLLIIMTTITKDIAATSALVIFLAIRMEGQIYTGVSNGLMRYVRAQVNSDQ